MKLMEVHNIKLYKELELLEPEYYYGHVDDINSYSKSLFSKINSLLAKNNINFIAESYHKSRVKDKIELWKRTKKMINKTKWLS